MPAWKLRRCEPSPQTARPQNGLPIPSKGRRTNGDTMNAAMAREAQTEAFDNFWNSPYTETSAMQNGDEEVGTRGGYGRWNPDGVDFFADDRRAEGKTPEKPAFSGTGSTDNGIPEDGGSRFGGETPEKVWEISGHRYAYGQPDAADYTVPVRTTADYPALTKIFFCSPIPRPQRVRGFFLLRKRRGLHRPRPKMPGTLNPARPGCSAAVMAGTDRQKAFSPR